MGSNIKIHFLTAILLMLTTWSVKSQSIDVYYFNKEKIDSMIRLHAKMDSTSFFNMIRMQYPSNKVEKDVQMMKNINEVFINDSVVRFSQKQLKKKEIFLGETTNDFKCYHVYGKFLRAKVYTHSDSLVVDIMCTFECDYDFITMEDYYNFSYLNLFIIPYIKYPIYFGKQGFFSFKKVFHKTTF